MPTDVHTGNRDSSLRKRLRHRTGLEECNDFVLEFAAIHGCDEIDKAALGTAGVETGNQMTNTNRQSP